MRTAAKATIIAAALLLTPAAALAASKTTTSTTTTPAASATTPASVPTTTITTSTPGSSSTSLLLAPPRPANLTSGHAALTAYETYLQTLVGSEASSQADAAAYVNTVESGESGESGCKSALEPLTQGVDAVRPAVQNTLTLLGKEIGDDLAISYDSVAQGPLEKLASVLDRLKWVHGGHNGDVITSYLTAETTLLTLAQSTLCQDVLLAASKPATTPDGTRAFLTQYAESVRAASSALGDFLVLLRAYETAADRPVLRRITALADEFAANSKADLLASGQQLTASLETS